MTGTWREGSRRRRGSRCGHAVAVLAVLCLAISLLLAGCVKPTPTDSGVRGTVRIGPISPVQREGEPADAPYAADLIVRAAGGAIVARGRSAADGTFAIALAPGEYTIEGEGGSAPPTPPAPQAFTVRAHVFAVVQLAYDSGIR